MRGERGEERGEEKEREKERKRERKRKRKIDQDSFANVCFALVSWNARYCKIWEKVNREGWKKGQWSQIGAMELDRKGRKNREGYKKRRKKEKVKDSKSKRGNGKGEEPLITILWFESWSRSIISGRRDHVLASWGFIDDGDGGVTSPDRHASWKESPSIRPRVVVLNRNEIWRTVISTHHVQIAGIQKKAFTHSNKPSDCCAKIIGFAIAKGTSLGSGIGNWP